MMKTIVFVEDSK